MIGRTEGGNYAALQVLCDVGHSFKDPALSSTDNDYLEVILT